jgi:general secretion pathway protein K
MRRRGPAQRGFALIFVLWTLAFLSLLGTALVATGRQDTQRLRNLLDAAAAEAAAEGALHRAIFALLETSEQRWIPDGSVHALRIGPYLIELRVEDEGGKVNPNIASAELLQALMVQLGASPPQAAGLAAAILDWREPANDPRQLAAKTAPYAAAGRAHGPPGESFETFDELGAVLGMTPELLARMRPHLTLHSAVNPDSSTTDPVVAAALGDRMRLPPRPDTGQRPRAVTVRIRLRGPDGTQVTRRVVVRTSPLNEQHPYEILLRDSQPWPGP